MIVGTGVLGLGGNDMLLEVVVGVSSCIGSSVVDDVARRNIEYIKNVEKKRKK